MQDCGKCTICCILPKIIEMDSPCGEYCKECIPCVGCNIYKDRPEPCREFQCSWSQMNFAHIDLRPNNCGVMFEKVNETLMLGSVIGKLKDISELIKNQIRFFNDEGISVMMQQFNPHKFICYMVKGASKEKIQKALEEKSK